MYKEGKSIERPMTKKEKEYFESGEWKRLPSFEMIEQKG